MRALALPRLDARAHARLAERVHAARDHALAVALLARRAPQQRVEVLERRVLVALLARRAARLGEAPAQAADLALKRRRALLGARERAVRVRRAPDLRGRRRVGGAFSLVQLGLALAQACTVAVRLGKCARVRLQRAPQRAHLVLRRGGLLAKRLFNVCVPLEHLVVALGRARKRPLLCVERVLGTHRAKVLVVRLALLCREPQDLVLEARDVDNARVVLLVERVVRRAQAVHLVRERRRRRHRAAELQPERLDLALQTLPARARRVGRRLAGGAAERLERLGGRRDACSQLLVLLAQLAQRTLERRLHVLALELSRDVRLTARRRELEPQAPDLAAQRLHALILGAHEAFELVQLREAHALARAALEQLSVQLVALAAEAHCVRIALPQLLLQLLRVRISLRRRLALEFRAELAHRVVLGLQRVALCTEALELLLHKDRLRIQLMVHRMRRDALVRNVRELRAQLLSGSLCLGELRTHVVHLAEARRRERRRLGGLRGRRLKRARVSRRLWLLRRLGLGCRRRRRLFLLDARLLNSADGAARNTVRTPLCSAQVVLECVGARTCLAERGSGCRERLAQRARFRRELVAARLGGAGPWRRRRTTMRGERGEHALGRLGPRLEARNEVRTVRHKRDGSGERRMARANALVDMQDAQVLEQQVPEAVHREDAAAHARFARLERGDRLLRPL